MQNEWFIWVVSRIVKYQSLLGAILGSGIGSFFAGLIAYRSIKTGFNNQKKLESDKALKEENKKLLYHKGVLTTLYVNLQNHYLGITILRGSFESLLNDYKTTHQIIAPEVTILPSTEILNKILFRIIEYEQYDRQILSGLTTYIGIYDTLAKSLNLEFFKKNDPYDDGDNMVDEIINSIFFIIDKMKAVLDSLIIILERDPDIESVKSFNLVAEAKDNI